MQRDRDHLAVVISATEASDQLRSKLLEAGIAPAAVTTSLRGLRRLLVLGEVQRTTLCITLDQSTLQRHGDALRMLLQDQRGFATVLTAIGITGREPLTATAASLGCSVYIESFSQAVDAVCYFEAVHAPLHPRCSGSWLQPQWMADLDHLRVGAASTPDDNQTKRPNDDMTDSASQ